MLLLLLLFHILLFVSVFFWIPSSSPEKANLKRPMMIQCTRQVDGRGRVEAVVGVWEGAEAIRNCRQVQVELVRAFRQGVNREEKQLEPLVTYKINSQPTT